VIGIEIANARFAVELYHIIECDFLAPGHLLLEFAFIQVSDGVSLSHLHASRCVVLLAFVIFIRFVAVFIEWVRALILHFNDDLLRSF